MPEASPNKYERYEEELRVTFGHTPVHFRILSSRARTVIETEVQYSTPLLVSQKLAGSSAFPAILHGLMVLRRLRKRPRRTQRSRTRRGGTPRRRRPGARAETAAWPQLSPSSAGARQSRGILLPKWANALAHTTLLLQLNALTSQQCTWLAAVVRL